MEQKDITDINETLSTALKIAIDTNRYSIKGCDLTIIPTELAFALYNMLMDDN